MSTIHYSDDLRFIADNFGKMKEEQLHSLSQQDRRIIKTFIEAKPGSHVLPADLKNRVSNLKGRKQGLIERITNWVLNKLGLRIGLEHLPLKKANKSDLLQILPQREIRNYRINLKKELLIRGFLPFLDIDLSHKLYGRSTRKNIDFTGITFQNITFTDELIFQNCILSNCIFRDCIFEKRISFRDCKVVSDTDFINCKYPEAKNRAEWKNTIMGYNVNFDVKTNG